MLLQLSIIRQCCRGGGRGGVLVKEVRFSRGHHVKVQASYHQQANRSRSMDYHSCKDNGGQLVNHTPVISDFNCCGGVRRRISGSAGRLLAEAYGGALKVAKKNPVKKIYQAKVPVDPEAVKQIKRENREIMARLLGGPPGEVVRTPSRKIDEERAAKMYKVLCEFGFSGNSIRLYPELLQMQVAAVENYIRIMQETCFPSSSIRETVILRFRILNKQSISVLQEKMFLPEINTIIERYCAELEESESFRKEFMGKLPQCTDRTTLLELRSEMIAAYLQKLSLGSVEELKKAFITYPRIHYRSLNWIRRNYELLTKRLDFTNDKIMKHYYLLHADTNQMKEMIEKTVTIGGMPFKTACHRRPKILMSTYDTITQIENSLIRHNISFESVQKYPEIYTLASDTIRERLRQMDEVPEFQLLKSHPRVARLLYYYNKAKSRLEEFQAHKLRVPAPSLHLLSRDTKSFKKTLLQGDMRIRGVDTMIYFADIFCADRKRIRESLTRHPHWLHVPLINIQHVLNLVKSLGDFSNDRLIDAIPLLLYPLEKVQEGIDEVLKSGEAAPSDPYFLQMVLYFIERPSHFSGDAVWPINQPQEDEHEEIHNDEGYEEDVVENEDKDECSLKTQEIERVASDSSSK